MIDYNWSSVQHYLSGSLPLAWEMQIYSHRQRKDSDQMQGLTDWFVRFRFTLLTIFLSDATANSLF